MRRAAPTALAILLLAGPALAGPWELPPEGACTAADTLAGFPLGEDAPPIPFKAGDVVSVEQLAILENFLPEALWQHREKFFYEGMRLEIGPCFRDYSPPAFFHEATEKFAGQARVAAEGGLEGHTAGLPFPPAQLAADDAELGQKWAWNVAQRYQAGGMFSDDFRISDLVGRVGRAEPFIGEVFKLQMSNRADQAEADYQAKGARTMQWVAGGKFDAPQPARFFAWRQFRDLENQVESARSDDLHAYLPEWRRVRRLNAALVEGLYLPSFSVGTVPAKTLAIGMGGGAYGGDGGIGGVGGVGGSVGGAIQTKRSGFEGLEARPNLYENRVLGVRDILAPLNAATPMYPEADERSFGPWGLSFASDRWDLRRALVIEGRAKDLPGGQHTARFIKYVDLQTLHPLYYAAYDQRDELIDLGMFVGRWSEDREDYPRWPDDPERPVRLIDSVGAAFANIAESGSWRRESWTLHGIPPTDNEIRKLLSVGNLTKGR
jgi:hypothetical protein